MRARGHRGWHDEWGEAVDGMPEGGGCGSVVSGGRSIGVGREEGKGETRERKEKKIKK